ncbi:MAG: hypothetical protein ABSG70_04905 [Terriglobales bacterium]|jgi:hypothetical protein
MEYHIRPMDAKHAVLLPIGHESEFNIKKDRLFLKVADGDKKVRPFQVVSMEPLGSGNKAENTEYHPPPAPVDSRPPDVRPAQQQPAPMGSSQAAVPPPQPAPPPQ